MIHLLLPKEDKFHRLLDQLGESASQSVQALYDLIYQNGDPAVLADRISQIKRQAKTHHELLLHSLSNTLITPFDREDLQELSVELYDIPKRIEKIKDRMVNHKLTDRQGDMAQFADLLKQCDENMDGILQELAGKLSTKNIPAKATRLGQLEDQCNALLEKTLVESFASIEDTRELILRTRIYEMLEHVSDFYRDAANVALRIVLKHS